MDKSDLVLSDFPASLIPRIDRFRERLKNANPGANFTRTACVTTLLVRALAEIEGQERFGRRKEDRFPAPEGSERRQRPRRWQDRVVLDAEREAEKLLRL